MSWDQSKTLVAKELKKIRAVLCFALGIIFGNVKWTPPQWLRLLCNKLKPIIERIEAHIKANPRKAAFYFVAFIGFIIGGVSSYLWYEARPKPILTAFKVSRLYATPLKEGARPYPLRVEFNRPVAPLQVIGKKVTKGIIAKPKLKGQWTWSDEKTLLFEVHKDWAVDKEYEVKFDPRIFHKTIVLKENKFTFKTAPFSAKMDKADFYQDPVDANLRKAIISLSFSHPVDTDSFERSIQLKLGDKKLNFNVIYGDFYGAAHVHTEPLPVPDKDSYVSAVFAPKYRAARGGNVFKTTLGNRKVVLIPGKFTHFKFKDVSSSYVRGENLDRILILRSSVKADIKDIAKAVHAHVLPEYHPKKQTDKPYEWTKLGYVSDDVLSRSKPLHLEPVESEHQYSTTHTFRHQAKVGQYVYVQIDKGIPSYGGHELGTTFRKIVRIDALPKELEIIGKGSILSLGGNLKVSIFSRGIRKLKFEIGRVIPSYMSYFVSQTYGDFSNPFLRSGFSKNSLVQRFTAVEKLPELPEGEGMYSSFDFANYLESGERGLLFFNVSSDDSNPRIFKNRFILITDLGTLVKESVDGSRDVFVLNISSGRPVKGALVKVLGMNGMQIASAQTDKNGKCSFGSLRDLKLERKPIVYVVQKDEDYTFLPYERTNLVQDVSRFDVGGVRVTEASDENQLRSFLFSDRGIYRPGEEIKVGMIVKALNLSKSLEGTPIQLNLNDPRGATIKRWNIQLSKHSLEEISYKTHPNSLTGHYYFYAQILQDGKARDIIGSTNVIVEEFLPDKLKITAHLVKKRKKGWVSTKDLKASVVLKNLFGTPAVDRKVKGDIRVSPLEFYSYDYRDYVFWDPLEKGKPLSKDLGETMTDQKGIAEFDLPLELLDDARYELIFTAEGFESKGGRSVVAIKSVMVSPLDYVVGYKSETNLNYIPKGEDVSIELLALDSSVNPIEVGNLKAVLMEQKYVSALTETKRGTFKYVSVAKEDKVSEKSLSIAKKQKFLLDTSKIGTFILSIKDDHGKTLSKVRYVVAGSADLTRPLEKHAELKIIANKESYMAGEEIELSISAPYTGSGIVSIERDRVYEQKWFKSTTTSTIQRIRIPEGLEGNAYVSVAFIRDPNSREIFMSPLSYGVIPFFINKEARKASIEIESADLVKPGQTYTVKYRMNGDSKIVLFAVDEGILQVSRYKTPNPLAFFFEKRALQVKTWQILSLILPEYELIMEHGKIGGGLVDGKIEALGKNLNPFRRKGKPPVAFWSGILDAGPEFREYSFTMPDYFNGSLRVMAVAISREQVGAVDKKVIVRGDLVMAPNLPMFVAPGDEFVATIMVANNIENSHVAADVDLSLSVSEHFEIIGKSTTKLEIEPMEEKSAEFRLKAKSKLGSGEIKFLASAGDKRASLTEGISIRPVNPYQTVVQTGALAKGKKKIMTSRRMYDEFRKLEVKASHLPLAMIGGTMEYLKSFPYLCTEQLTSKAFPALMLSDIPQWVHSKRETSEAILEVINIIQSRQGLDGGFGLWSANSSVQPLTSLYALQFLLEAKSKGYPVSNAVLELGHQYLVEVLRGNGTSLSALRLKAYAIYLLTKMDIVTTQYLNTFLKELEEIKKQKWSSDSIAIYLSMIYSFLQQDELAEKVIDGVDLRKKQQTDYMHLYSDLVRDSLYLYALSTHFQDELEDFNFIKMEEMARSLEGDFNTYFSANFALAIGAYAEHISSVGVRNFSLSEILDNSENALKLSDGQIGGATYSPKATSILVRSKGDLPTYYSIFSSGFDLAQPKTVQHNNIEVTRFYTKKGKPIGPEGIKVGEDIEINIRMRSYNNANLHPNIVIVDLLPGGFDPDIDNIRNGTCSYSNTEIEHRAPSHIDIREDRVLLFIPIDATAAQYCYQMKAVNAGKFQIPPLFAHSMYNPATWSKSPGGMIEISE